MNVESICSDVEEILKFPNFGECLDIIEAETEHFACWAVKKDTHFVIDDEVVSVYQFSVDPTIDVDDVFDEYGRFIEPEYQQEYIEAVKTIIDGIEKETPLFIAFIWSDNYAWDYFEGFSGLPLVDQDFWFIQRCYYEGPTSWQTWIESSTLADKRAKDAIFQVEFEKWALSMFLCFTVVSFSPYKGYLRIGNLEVDHFDYEYFTDLPLWLYFDVETETFRDFRDDPLTEEEFDQLYEELTTKANKADKK